MTVYTAWKRTVYFLRPVGEQGPIKVGCSKNAEYRCLTIGWQRGLTLEVVAKLRGSMDDERRVHSFLWDDHRGHEWFSWSPRLQAIIDSVVAGTFDFDQLPPTKVRPMPDRRRPWSEDQKALVRQRNLDRKLRQMAQEEAA